MTKFGEFLFYFFAFTSAFSISASTVLLSLMVLIYIYEIGKNIKKTPFDFLYFVMFYFWRGLSLVLNGYLLGFLKGFGDIWDKLPYPASSAFNFNKEVVERFINFLILVNIMIFIYALGQKYLGFPIILKQLFTGDWLRFKGYHSHPLRFAGYLSTVFVIAFSFGLFYSRRYLYFSFILFVAIILNGSRSYWLSLFIVIVFLCYLNSVKKMIYMPLIFILLGGMVLYFSKETLRRIELSFERRDKVSDIDLRKNFWIVGLEIFKSSPIYGVGAKRVSSYLENYKEKGLIDNTAHCHNVYITNLAESGIIGGGILIFLFVYFIRKYFLIGRNLNDDFSKAFAFSIMACWINVAVAGFFESNFSTFSLWSLLSLWMGMFEGYKRN